ncbi:hypothetical protein CEXT_74791 [Caerostris extrusa]|uniref:Uncharacterized protein n=1 Tax=Caerostris extrusa TaxID=172846 RepID=A0AAV4S9Q4_CAEEX|nr:hypothetical protein CEXT_74791 [Caerostris extrusa]
MNLGRVRKDSVSLIRRGHPENDVLTKKLERSETEDRYPRVHQTLIPVSCWRYALRLPVAMTTGFHVGVIIAMSDTIRGENFGVSFARGRARERGFDSIHPPARLWEDGEQSH